MKKLIALMMALAIVASFAACGTQKDTTEDTKTQTTTGNTETTTGENNNEDTNTDSGNNGMEIVDTTTALEILEFAWMQIGAENQPSAYGGHVGEDGEYYPGPNSYELAYAEDLAAKLLLPTDQMDKVVDAATVIHLLNANSMTAGVVKLQEGADVKAFADATADRISNNQWMCGFPEKMVIIQISDDFLFVGFGLTDLLDPMVKGMSESWTVTELCNQSLE